MAIVGKNAKSIKKKDLSNQKNIGVGFKKLRFWHKASAGETGMDLLSLVFPTELAPTGRQNPSKFELADANIKFFKNNLTVRSSLRGVLMDGLAYDVSSSTRINWLNFTTAEGEIFEVTLDENAKTGRNIVDGRQVIASGILPAGETDINLGTAFEINKNPNANVGAVTLHLDRALQLRNTNNSDTTKDKDYHEVDPGGGLGIILRVNTPDLSNDREYVVMSLGVVAEKPNESQLQELEKVQGQIDAMIPTLAALAGVDESDFQSSGPNSIDLKAFGDLVTQLNNTIESIKEVEIDTVEQQSIWDAANPITYNGNEIEFDLGGFNNEGDTLIVPTNDGTNTRFTAQHDDVFVTVHISGTANSAGAFPRIRRRNSGGTELMSTAMDESGGHTGANDFMGQANTYRLNEGDYLDFSTGGLFQGPEARFSLTAWRRTRAKIGDLI